MTFKGLINTFYRVFCPVLHGFYGAAPAGIIKSHPKADGTFIQLDMAYAWDDLKWQREFRYMKEVGMHYLVAMGISLTSKGETKTVYPTSIPGCRMDTGTDVVDVFPIAIITVRITLTRDIIKHTSAM